MNQTPKPVNLPATLRMAGARLPRRLVLPKSDEGRSNTKARGPMGLEELTSYKWLGIGNGQIRT